MIREAFSQVRATAAEAATIAGPVTVDLLSQGNLTGIFIAGGFAVVSSVYGELDELAYMAETTRDPSAEQVLIDNMGSLLTGFAEERASAA